MRICFFGDSFVNGTGDDDGLGWVGRVVARARQGGCDLTAYNLGIRRDTSHDVAARWMREALPRLPPEDDRALVFSFGTNDCLPGAPGGAARVRVAQTLTSARSILTAARDWLPTLMIGPAAVASDDSANERIGVLSGELDQLCGVLGLPYLDIFALTRTSRVWAEEALAGDGAHPNRGGYTLVADAVSAWSPWRAWICKPT